MKVKQNEERRVINVCEGSFMFSCSPFFFELLQAVKILLYFSHKSFQSSPFVIYNVLLNGHNSLKSVKCDLAKERSLP